MTDEEKVSRLAWASMEPTPPEIMPEDWRRQRMRAAHQYLAMHKEMKRIEAEERAAE